MGIMYVAGEGTDSKKLQESSLQTLMKSLMKEWKNHLVWKSIY